MVNADWTSALWPSDYRLLRCSAAYRQDGVEAAETRGKNLKKNLSKTSAPNSDSQTGTCGLGSGRAPQTSASFEHNFVSNGLLLN